MKSHKKKKYCDTSFCFRLKNGFMFLTIQHFLQLVSLSRLTPARQVQLPEHLSRHTKSPKFSSIPTEVANIDGLSLTFKAFSKYYYNTFTNHLLKYFFLYLQLKFPDAQSHQQRRLRKHFELFLHLRRSSGTKVDLIDFKIFFVL
jgi:hypothetical protein